MTQFPEVQVSGAMLQKSWQHHELCDVTRLRVGNKNVLYWFLLTDLQTGILVIFILCILTSAITETVDALTKTGLLILAGIRKGELISQMAVTGEGTETSRTCKQCTNDLWIYLGLQNLCFLKRWKIFLVGMWMLVLDNG